MVQRKAAPDADPSRVTLGPPITYSTNGKPYHSGFRSQRSSCTPPRHHKALGVVRPAVERRPYRFGWHVDLWDSGVNMNANWHCACVIAWQFWNAPSDYARLLRRLQARRCGQSGGRLWKSAEVDHRVPLFRVWSEHRETPWPDLLTYWGLPNLQVINRDVHAVKCAIEARDRRAARVAGGARHAECVSGRVSVSHGCRRPALVSCPRCARP